MNVSGTRRRWSLSLTGFIVAAMLAMLAMPFAAKAQVATPNQTPESAITRTISVSGIGRVTTTPDTASVMFTIETTDKSLKTAQDDVTTRTSAVTDAITGAGVRQEDVQTANYSVNPLVRYDDDGNYIGIDGYQVSLSLAVTVRDLDALGTLLDTAVTAGADQVGGIYLYVNDPTLPTQQARSAAIADARAKADQYAQETGSLITGVYSIVETSAPAPAAQEYDTQESAAPASGGARKENPVPINTGSTEIVVYVDVVYTIEPGNG